MAALTASRQWPPIPQGVLTNYVDPKYIWTLNNFVLLHPIMATKPKIYNVSTS